MEITNLGQADGLPPVNWATVAATLEAGSAPGSGRAELPHDLAGHGQRGR